MTSIFERYPPKPKKLPLPPAGMPACTICGAAVMVSDRVYNPRLGWVHRITCPDPKS